MRSFINSKKNIMGNLFDLLQGHMDENVVDHLSNQIGGADRAQTATAAQSIVSTLLAGLAKNASTPEGAASLNNALERDHDGSLLDNLMGMLGGGGQAAPEQSRALNGAGIINHILGPSQSGAIDMISKMSGLDSNKTGNLMTTLAPMVMSLLGQQKKQQGLDVSGLAGLLSNSVGQQRQAGNPLMDMATRFLDKDGDGSMMDDVAGMVGKGLLSKLFGGR
ncbi:MAG: DUF937 domain-containing protein [Bacteroidetes bacterium]|nr:DUF937 domain-containing protein [Bacteroidota bacterium]